MISFLKVVNRLIFATSNEGKLKEARAILGIDIEGTALKIDEVQSLNEEYVAEKKARAYFGEIKKPIFVEDVSLRFNAIGGLPGTYINDFLRCVGNSGLLELMSNFTDKSATAITTIGYINDDEKVHVFKGTLEGQISEEEKGENGFGWDPIFIPKGFSQTLAQMTSKEKNRISMRAAALQKLQNYLKTS